MELVEAGLAQFNPEAQENEHPRDHPATQDGHVGRLFVHQELLEYHYCSDQAYAESPRQP